MPISACAETKLKEGGITEVNLMRKLAWIFRGGRCVVGIGLFFLVALNIDVARAQTTPTTSTKLSAAQLEQLVAPIALYPDALLSQVLMASTYPLEVVAAARWSQANPTVTGDALQTAMQQQPWDPSVKALAALPQTLQMMSDKLDWTQQLGDAFLAQQNDVLNAVQALRARADANGQLKSTPEQKVTTAPRPAAQRSSVAGGVEAVPANVYTIESTNPEEYYVPIYDPGVVYGTWPYPSYPPYYWYPPGWVAGNVFSFAAGVAVGSAIWGNVNWNRNFVSVNPLRYNNFNRTNIANIGNGNWVHNPAHRGAVPYRDAGVAQRFGQQGQSAAREAFRGKANAGRGELAKQGAAGKLGQGAGGKLGQGAGGKVGQGAGGKVGQGAAGSKAGAAKTAAANRAAGNKAGNKGAGSKSAAAKKAAGNKAASNRKAGGTKQARAAPRGGQAARNVSRGGGARTAARGGGARGGGGIARAGGGRGGGARASARGGGRRSDVRLKHDIVLLGHLDDGLGFYRFSYNGSSKAYVGVMAQEVQTVMPQAVSRDRDGYLRVFYDRLGVPFQTYDHWIASGARIPTVEPTRH
jgi:hypothetical protein